MTPNDMLRTRLRPLHALDNPLATGRYVLYWMQQQRRLHDNFALQHAVYQANTLGLPLLIYEALRVDYPFAADRHHGFALASMIEHRQVLADTPGIGYFPYVEMAPGEGKGLVDALVGQAAWVVTDEIPCFIVPGHNRALQRIARSHNVPATAVDSCGLLPIALLDKPCPSAAVFRRHVHKHMAHALQASPSKFPLKNLTSTDWDAKNLNTIHKRWPASHEWLDSFATNPVSALAQLPIDHDVPYLPGRGGTRQGQRELEAFVANRLAQFGEKKGDACESTHSGLSPYLHWGHLSSHEIVQAAWEHERPWDPGLLPEKGGKRIGFWPLSEPTQTFLDQICTWRELGHHTASLRPELYDSFDIIPDWAQKSLMAHSSDTREFEYTLEEFEQGRTHDDIWNATMGQLREDGIIHSYLRMLWSKKILEWSPNPQQAYEWTIYLNNKWAVDGRNANSWSGVLWCFGLYDRPWFERDVFGVIRFMSSASTSKKMKLGSYLERYTSTIPSSAQLKDG